MNLTEIMFMCISFALQALNVRYMIENSSLFQRVCVKSIPLILRICRQ